MNKRLSLLWCIFDELEGMQVSKLVDVLTMIRKMKNT